MSTVGVGYGIIPTTTTNYNKKRRPPTTGLESSMYDRARSRTEAFIATRRPWRELLKLFSLSRPDNYSEAMSRISTVNGFPAISHARPLIASVIQLILSELPFWNHTRGSDHVFVASHDYGACFHAMDNVTMANGIPEFLRNSIILQTFCVKYQYPYQDVENVVIPPYVSSKKVQSTLSKSRINGRRDIFALSYPLTLRFDMLVCVCVCLCLVRGD